MIDFTTHLWEWLNLKKLTIQSIAKDLEELQLSYTTTGRNVIWPTTLANSAAVSLKAEHTHATLSSHFTAIHLFKEGERCPYKDWYINVRSSFTCSLSFTPYWKQSKCSPTDDCINKLYPHSGILLGDKEERTSDRNNMVEYQNISAEW